MKNISYGLKAQFTAKSLSSPTQGLNFCFWCNYTTHFPFSCQISLQKWRQNSVVATIIALSRLYVDIDVYYYILLCNIQNPKVTPEIDIHHIAADQNVRK